MKPSTLFLLILLAGQALGLTLAWAQDFEETTDQSQDTGNPSFEGGLNAREIAAMTNEQRKIFRRFQKGRYSSAKGEAARYGNFFEIHDNNDDGVTDHDGGANAMEAATEEIATGGKLGLKGVQRQKALAKARGTAGDCKVVPGTQSSDPDSIPLYMSGNPIKLDPFSDATEKLYDKIKGSKHLDTYTDPNSNEKFYYLKCQNVSSVVLDRGAAHGNGDVDAPHRVHEVNPDFHKKAESIAEEYNDRVVADASDYGATDAELSSMRRQGADISSNKQENRRGTMTVRRKGQVFATGMVAPDLDKLRSEYAWAERQKEYAALKGFKEKRARRLAGLESNYDDQEFGSLIARGATDEEIAERIADKKALVNAARLCYDPRKKTMVDCPTSGSAITITLGQYKNNKGNLQNNQLVKVSVDELGHPLIQLGGSRDQVIQTALKKAKDELKKDDNAYRQYEKDKKALQAKVVECMKIDVWCATDLDDIDEDLASKIRSQNPGDTTADQFVPLKGLVDDPAGAAVQDTRELLFAEAYKSSQGPLSKFMGLQNGGGNMDFNESTDQKTQTKPFAAMKRAWEAAMQAARNVMRNESKTKGFVDKDGNIIKKFRGSSRFNDKNFNPDTMNTVQLFGRDPNRDGSTLGLGEMPSQRPEDLGGFDLNSVNRGAASDAGAGNTQAPQGATAAPDTYVAPGSAPARSLMGF